MSTKFLFSMGSRGIELEDSEKITKGFAFYLEQEFGYDKNILRNGLDNILSRLSNDNHPRVVLCFYSYLYFKEYIKRQPDDLKRIKSVLSNLIYLVFVMVYIARCIISDAQIVLGSAWFSSMEARALFNRNVRRVMKVLDYRLSIVNMGLHGPYGNIREHYEQLLEWGDRF